MPRGNGTGPRGQGPRGGGGGRGMGGRGRQGGFAAGPGGDCICPSCGKKVAHTRGVPCNSMKCPGCGALMTREL